MTSRVGIGFDAHQLSQGRPLVLGGVTIPFHKGLSGHSDGDVLVHAIIDALLGAAGLGDKGVYFPSSDPSYEGAALSIPEGSVSVKVTTTDHLGFVGREEGMAAYAVALLEEIE